MNKLPAFKAETAILTQFSTGLRCGSKMSISGLNGFRNDSERNYVWGNEFSLKLRILPHKMGTALIPLMVTTFVLSFLKKL